MDEMVFLEALKRAVERCQLEPYILPVGAELAAVESHWDISLNVAAVKADMASPGGLKLSHAQRRMLQVVATLWNSRSADELFGLPFSELVPVVMSMDRENREILAELLYSYPGWRD